MHSTRSLQNQTASYCFSVLLTSNVTYKISSVIFLLNTRPKSSVLLPPLVESFKAGAPVTTPTSDVMVYWSTPAAKTRFLGDVKLLFNKQWCLIWFMGLIWIKQEFTFVGAADKNKLMNQLISSCQFWRVCCTVNPLCVNCSRQTTQQAGTERTALWGPLV